MFTLRRDQAMFESLSDKLQAILGDLTRQGTVSQQDLEKALRDVRLALLEADVNYGVVKDFSARLSERAVGAGVLRSLTPGQQVIALVRDELVELLGRPAALDLGRGTPPVILMAGLQGSGKTTTAAKLALLLRKRGRRPLLVAADTRRPAAIDQLQALGRQLDIPVHAESPSESPLDIARRGVEAAARAALNVVIVDTSGRLQLDSELMAEIEAMAASLRPAEALLVIDAMTGQEAVAVAEEFKARLPLTGLVMTKLDGDARGGAALSVRAVTGLPIKFLGTGEKATELEEFQPERMAGRILGMGDVLTLIERAEATYDPAEATRLESRLKKGQFDLDDFLGQLRQIKKMGPLQEVLAMIPGVGSAMRQKGAPDIDDGQLKQVEAIILSMTPQERRQPKLLDGSRRRRIALGSGTTVTDVNQLVRQFAEMQNLMKQISKGRLPRGFRN